LLIAAACGSSAEKLSLDSSGYPNGATSGFGSASSGAGGLDINNNYTGGSGGMTSPLAQLCGGGCTPGTGVSESCTLNGSGGAGGAGGSNMGACQLGVVGKKVEGICGVIGSAQNGEPCLSTHDCAAGFACVSKGVCRPYCCASSEACAPASYCAATPLAAADAPQASPPQIPVCVPAEPCTLLDDKTCAKAGQTCTIVRTDGTTSCIDPGPGKEDEACPCAAGYFCSAAQNKCLRLCRTKMPSDCKAGWQCMGGSKPYPAGYGVCVKL
jgi:hypothetical protein